MIASRMAGWLETRGLVLRASLALCQAACLIMLCMPLSALVSVQAQSVGSPTVSAETRPFILFVHGRDQMGREDSTIVNEWIGAFKEGLARVGVPALVGPNDVAFVMYQHFFEAISARDSACAGSGPVLPGVASHDLVDHAFATAKMTYQDPKKRDPGGVALDFLRASTARIDQPFLQRLALRKTVDTKNWLVGGTAYCSTQRAIRNGIELARGRPLIIVAHSMGGLATYRLLVHDTALIPAGTRIERLVTFGTQIGYADFPQRLSGVERAPFPYPAGINRWINVREVSDPLAWPTYTATSLLFDTNATTHTVPIDVPIHISDEKWHHAISGYLSNPIAVRAIVAGWCRAISPRPRECGDYRLEDVGPGTGPIAPPSWNAVTKKTFRFGLLSGGGAALGVCAATCGSQQGGGGKIALLAGVGAVAGSFISLAWDRWFPNL